MRGGAGWQAFQAGLPLIALVVVGPIGLSVFFRGRDQTRDVIYNRTSDPAARLSESDAAAAAAAAGYSSDKPSAKRVAQAQV